MSDKRRDIIEGIDPNGVGQKGFLYGLPFTEETAGVVVLPVPWEVTGSYGSGTSEVHPHLLDASLQVDLYIKEIQESWKLGIFMSRLKNHETINETNGKLRGKVQKSRETVYTDGEEMDESVIDAVNSESEKLNSSVCQAAQNPLQKGKIAAILGGDHSTSLGLIRALGEYYDQFGILQIDAHLDLRRAYEGFQYSHASIMYNALEVPSVGQLVSVGARDYCQEEIEIVRSRQERITVFFDDDIKSDFYEGEKWANVVDKVMKKLPENVYVSFDIDGLNPELCPNTGTPVPGGLSFESALYLIKSLVKSGRKIIGFDLCEVSLGNQKVGDWDANVGARLLYHLSCWAGVSQGRLKLAQSV